MVEVELRAKTHADIKKILDTIGAQKKSEKNEEDEYFKFEGDVERKLVIRIRKKQGKEFLTFKGKSVLKEDIAWPEWEDEIHNAHGLKSVMLANGLIPVVTIKKHRETYTLDSYEINIDHIEDLGEFVEVELQSEDANNAQKQ